MRWNFSKCIVLIEIIYRSASVTDRLAELCIRWGRGFSILMSRMLFMIVIHTYREPSSISPIYAILSYRSDAILEDLSSWILKLDIYQFLVLCLFGRSRSVPSLTIHTAFCWWSCQRLSQCRSCLLSYGLWDNFFGNGCLVGICIAIGEIFHLLSNLSINDEVSLLLSTICRSS